MSKYYQPIDFSKYDYSVPEEIKALGHRPLTENESLQFKELLSSLIPQGVKDIASATVGVGKAALDIGIDKDKEKKDKESEKQKKLDYKQYAKFLQKGFKDYQDQYFVHPVIYVNEKERLTAYTLISMVTGSSVTLQPYKLESNNLYKIAKQKVQGKFTSFVQKVFGFPYKRVDYKKMTVDNISTSSDPIRDFKMDQIFKAPIYKELSRYNPVRGTKYTCSLIFYDESKRKLVIGENLGIEQVTQDRITLSKIHKVKDSKTKKDKDTIVKTQISLGLLIPAYASNINIKEEPKTESIFNYKHIFPVNINSIDEYNKLYEADEDKNQKKLILFYVRPLLMIRDNSEELSSFSASMETFNFDNYLNDISYLSRFMYGTDYRDSYYGDGGDRKRKKRIDIEKIRKFFEKYKTEIMIYGLTERLARILARYLGENYTNNNNLLKEEENKSDLENMLSDPENVSISLKAKFEEIDISNPQNPFVVLNITQKLGDRKFTNKLPNKLRIPISYFEYLNDKQDYPFILINERYFDEILTSQEDPEESSEESSQESINTVDIPDDSNNPPSNNTTTIDSMETTISNSEVSAMVNNDNLSQEEIIQAINDSSLDERDKKIAKIYEFIQSSVTNRASVDIIEVNDSIPDMQTFSNIIINAETMNDVAQYVDKKYEATIQGFDLDNENAVFVVENVKKLEFTPPQENSNTQESQQQNSNTQKKYIYSLYVDIDSGVSNTNNDPTSRYSRFRIWKVGDTYHYELNPDTVNAESRDKSMIYDTNYLSEYFTYDKKPKKDDTKIIPIESGTLESDGKTIIKKGKVKFE